jgi:hypothetical protein
VILDISLIIAIVILALLGAQRILAPTANQDWAQGGVHRSRAIGDAPAITAKTRDATALPVKTSKTPGVSGASVAAIKNFIISEMARKYSIGRDDGPDSRPGSFLAGSSLTGPQATLWNDAASPPESADFPDTYVRFRGCGMLDLQEGVLYQSPRRWGLMRA